MSVYSASDGPPTTGEVLQKYRALYGPRGARWRYATDTERADYEAEGARLRQLCARTSAR